MKITLQTKEGKKVYTPKESRITIGPPHLGATIPLPLPGLETFLVEIRREKGKWILINSDDNPDLSCNGTAFGARTLSGPVKLRFGEVALLIDIPTEKSFAYEPEEPLPEIEEPTQPEPAPKKRRGYALFALLPLLLILLYSLNSREEQPQNELAAALELADFAALHLFATQDADWSDSAFVTAASKELLPEALPLEKRLHPYSIEKLTDTLLVASAPNEKSALAVDLSEMKMRKVENFSELKKLARENESQEDIEALLLKSETVSLSEIESAFPNQLFASPKVVKERDRHADLYLYNAPRYYKIGDIPLKQKDKEKLSALSEKPHLIFTLRGEAKEAARAKELLPNEKLLFYFSPSKPYALPADFRLMTAEEALFLKEKPTEMELLMAKRRENLSPHAEHLKALLSEHLNHPNPNLYTALEEAFIQFEENDTKEMRDLFAKIAKLYEKRVAEEKTMTPKEFADCLENCGMKEFLLSPAADRL